jgi:hypothetical protein
MAECIVNGFAILSVLNMLFRTGNASVKNTLPGKMG